MTRYYHPDEFTELKRIALAMGFAHVEAGPLVRSSYHAHDQADAAAASLAARGLAAREPSANGPTG
jgi:lipoic acid synthetase